MKKKQLLIDYRNLPIAELEKNLAKLTHNLMTNLSDSSSNKVSPKKINTNIAQINTIINEKQRVKN